jgi:hypothetical protein
MNMKNMLKSVMLVAVFASVCSAQEGSVSVSSEGKQKWSPSEINEVYRSACTAVQREFGNSTVLSPTIALVLGAEKNEVNFDKKTILLKRWDRSLFAEGVVILAFEDLLTPQRRMVITGRAMNLAQATVNVREITK